MLVIISALLNSCALYINLDRDINEKKLVKNEKPSLVCKEIKGPTFISSKKDYVSIFLRFLTTVKIKLNSTDKFILWSLFQMNIRPDISSPTADFYTLIRQNDKIFYYHFHVKKKLKLNDTTFFPFLYGIKEIKNKFKGKQTILKLANLLDRHLPSSIPVSNDFEAFISKNRDQLFKNKIFRDSFFNGDKPLIHFENISKLNYTKLIKLFNKHLKKLKRNNISPYFSSTHQFPYHSSSLPQEANIDIRCNTDFNLYDNSVYLLSKTLNNNNFYGQSENQLSFMSITTQDFEKLSPIGENFVIKGRSVAPSLSMCFIKNNKTKSNISIISTKHRDPGQFIHSLIQYKIYNSTNLNELNEYIKFPRHLFLHSPFRMLYESKRGTEKQLKDFLKMSFPIYHSDNLGHITIHANFEDSKERGFIKDSRYQDYVNCN